MSSSEIKSRINKMLNKVNDERFLRTMYAMVSEYTGGDDFEFTAAEKKLLDERKKSHKAGRSKSYSARQMKELVLKGLK
jgi:hypothetical protein